MNETSEAKTIHPDAARVTLAEDIRTVTRAFSHRWRMMAAIVATFAIAGLLFIWFATPGFQSTVEILVDPRARNVVEGEVAPTGLGSSSFGADTALVDSQVGIITSLSVLGALIEKHELIYDPEFGRRGESLTSVLMSGVKAVLYGPNAAAYDSQTPFDRAMEKLTQAIFVERVGNTYILRIGVTTESPAKSALLAESLANLYLAEGQLAANSTSAEAASALEDRLAALKTAAEDAQHAVEDFRAANNLIGADDLPVDEAQLRDLNAQVTAAAVAVEDARARLEETQRLAQTPASATIGGNILTSPVAQGLRAQLDLALAEEQSLTASKGPLHPALVSARERRQSLEQALGAEFARIAGTAESDYQAALSKQQSLEAMRSEYTSRQGDANSASVELAELQRVADTQTAVYQSFLTRAIQARQQVALPASTARIISPAIASSEPSEPKVTTVLGGAIFAGVIVATATAWLQHVLGGTPAQAAQPTRPARLNRRPLIMLPRLKRPQKVKQRVTETSAPASSATPVPSAQRDIVPAAPQAATAVLSGASSTAVAPSKPLATNPPAPRRAVATGPRPVARPRAAPVPPSPQTQALMKKILAQLLR